MRTEGDFQLGLIYARRLASMRGEVGFLAELYIDLHNAHYAAKVPLTRCQRRVFDFLVQYSEEHGYAPTLGEMSDHFNYRSMATIHEHLEALASKGWIRRSFNMARGTLVFGGRSLKSSAGLLT